jgi:hypothetical protein
MLFADDSACDRGEKFAARESVDRKPKGMRVSLVIVACA